MFPEFAAPRWLGGSDAATVNDRKVSGGVMGGIADNLFSVAGFNRTLSELLVGSRSSAQVLLATSVLRGNPHSQVSVIGFVL